jgi:NTE family protein
MKRKADAVFEGGGVKGIGLVGAVAEIEKTYDFIDLAGTSAGAIVAALLAVGYTGLEIKEKLEALNYNDFKDEGLIDKFGVLGKALSFIFEYGIYEGDFFKEWLDELLEEKGITTFQGLRNDGSESNQTYRLRMIASDITDRRMLVLPDDLVKFGLIPDKFSISRAVRMSMSLPIFFEPVRLTDGSGKNHLIVDGGVLSNFPIWLFDSQDTPRWPTFGFKLVEENPRERKSDVKDPIKGIRAYATALVGTMLEAHDNYHISVSKGDLTRTIRIPTAISTNGGTKNIKTTDFDITKEESEKLFQNGVGAAKDFLESWKFESYKEKYRN